MAITNPRKIVFENQKDVIDYVCRGLPPTKANFEEVMLKVKYPDNDYDIPENPFPGQEVYIPKSIFIDCDQDTMDAVLREVYKDRCFNRNCMIGAVALVGGVIILGCLFGGSNDNNKDLENQN